MYKAELYGRVRRAVRVEGRSERAVAREFGISRETVRKMLRYAVPPGYHFLEGARGVQPAELGLKSWHERRWIDVPELEV